jgi:hypothetical protein
MISFESKTKSRESEERTIVNIQAVYQYKLDNTEIWVPIIDGLDGNLINIYSALFNCHEIQEGIYKGQLKFKKFMFISKELCERFIEKALIPSLNITADFLLDGDNLPKEDVTCYETEETDTLQNFDLNKEQKI